MMMRMVPNVMATSTHRFPAEALPDFAAANDGGIQNKPQKDLAALLLSTYDKQKSCAKAVA